MKKILFGLWAVLFGLFIYGCEKNTTETDYQQVLIEASNALSIETETDQSIELPLSMTYENLEITISWSSDNNTYLNQLGEVNRPTFEMGDKTVRLTALFTYDTYMFSRIFDVKVLKLAEDVVVRISFETDTDSTINDILIDQNNKISAPLDPTKVGYTFVGWAVNSPTGDLFDFNTPITTDLTLYAKYSVNTYQVTFETNGGSAIEPMTYAYLSDISEPIAPTKAFHQFLGWYQDASFNKPYTFGKMPLNGIKLYAKWQVSTFEISFETNGGSPIDTMVRAYNSVLSMPKAPTMAGYELEGWYLDTQFNQRFEFISMPAEDINLYAKWVLNEMEPLTNLDIFYLNDLHGSIEQKDQELGLAYIANYVNSYRDQNPNGVILLGGGDMFQGSALSNYYQGLSTLTIMNHMGFDAMTLGNHEFDWGIEVITNYFDDQYGNHEATFPLLGANVFYEGTEDIVDHLDPYTVIEREHIKIGVIGTIGYGLEDSIAQSRIDGFVFASPKDYIQTYATHLRQTEDVDYVFVLSHDPGDINNAVSSLTGDAKVDIIFNAHSHSNYTDKIYQTTIIQSGSNGKYVGKININLNTNAITATNVNDHQALNVADEKIQSIIDLYKAETDILFNTEIIESGSYYSTTHISNWLMKLMVAKTNADIAFHNYGGTRTNINNGESITLGKLYQIFPFDNIIKTVELDGATINNFMSKNPYYSNITEFKTGTKYVVVTNDYLFDKTDNPFIYGTNPTYDGTLLRDMVEDELMLQALVYPNFKITNTILTNNPATSSLQSANPIFYN